MKMDRKVVVTGLGLVTPNGIGVKDFWDNIINGRSFFKTPSVIQDITDYGTLQGSEIPDFDLDPYFLKEVKEGRFNRKAYGKLKNNDDKLLQLAILASKLALEDAGLDFKEIPYAGVIIGNAEEAVQSQEIITKLLIQRILKMVFLIYEKGLSFQGGLKGLYEAKRNLKKIKPDLEPENINRFISGLHSQFGDITQFTPPSSVHVKSYSIAAKISSTFGFHGKAMALNTACASGGDAICQACDQIRLGSLELAVAGGSEAPISLGAISALKTLGVLSNTYPKPYSINRDGFAISEGAGLLVLEEKQHALKRGARIYAEVKGYGSTMDANDNVILLRPDGKHLEESIQIAFNGAQLPKNSIDYINTHGTATSDCDHIETQVIKRVFADHAFKLNISATKSMTGHSVGATAAIEAAISCLAIQNGIVPPTINLYDPDPLCDLNYTPNTAIEKPVNNVLSLAMGFGGYNNAIILGRMTEE